MILSFIIPAYNAEKTLVRLVESIVKQYEGNNIEVLIVENGSLDETGKIAENLKRKYNIVQVFHSKKGVSAARNCGIQKAKGEYLAFVDADDILPNGSVGYFIESLRKDVDLLLGSYQKGDSIIDVTKECMSEEWGTQIERIRVNMIENPTKFMAVWAKAFRKEIILDNKIYFNECLTLAEDGDFMIRYTQMCKQILFTDKVLYCYTIDPDSTVRSYDGRKLQKYISAMNETKKAIVEDSKQVQKAFDKYVLMHLNLAMVHEVFASENKLSFYQKVIMLSKTSKEDIFEKAIRTTKITECMSFRMVPILLLKFHIHFLAGIVYLARVKQNKKSQEKCKQEDI